MGQIKNSVVLEKALRADFNKSYDNGENPADVMPFIMETTSSSNSEKYGWLGDVPQLTEWIDARKLNGVSDYDYTIANRDYEGTLQVDRNDIEDDQLGAIKVRIADLARVAKIHPRKLFFELILTGESALCYDGLPFFSASHVYKSGTVGTQSNLLSYENVAAIPTVAEFILSFEATRAAMRTILSENGEPYNEGELSLKIVASPAMEGILERAFNATLLNNETNVLKGAATFMTSARLSGASWYIADISGNVKPIVKQLRKAVEFNALEATSYAGFMFKKYSYGVDYRVGFGFGLWQKMFKVNYTVAA